MSGIPADSLRPRGASGRPTVFGLRLPSLRAVGRQLLVAQELADGDPMGAAVAVTAAAAEAAPPPDSESHATD